MFYPGPPPPKWFSIMFCASAVMGLIYFLVTDFWIGIGMTLFCTIGLWGEIAGFVRRMLKKKNGDI
jgi:hypothetical protein